MQAFFQTTANVIDDNPDLPVTVSYDELKMISAILDAETIA